MNGSRKGIAYENAYRAHLLSEGARLVFRSAASKGPFDLVYWTTDTVQPHGVQLKNATSFDCRNADKLLNVLATDWPEFIPYVVHKTTERVFCEH